MNRIGLIAALLVPMLAQGAPDKSQQVAALPAAALAGEPVLLRQLKGVRFGSDKANVLATDVGPGLDVGDVALLDTPTFQEVISYFLHKPVSRASLERLISATRVYLASVGYPYSIAYTPEQDITDGYLRVVVKVSKLDAIAVSGAHYFDEAQYTNELGIAPGDRINAARLQAGLDWINRNPYRHASLVTTPGDEPATTRLVVDVQEKKPWRYFLGANNTGSRSTGEDRILAGFNWGNAFGRGDQMTLQLTSDSEFKHSRSVFGTYSMYLSAERSLTFNGAYSKTDSIVEPPFNLTGQSGELGASYRQELPTRTDASNRYYSIGMDFKSSDNNFEFGGTPVNDNLTHVVQLRVGYGGAFGSRFGTTSYGTTVNLSPGHLTSKNNDTAFNRSRTGAKAEYAVLMANAMQSVPLHTQGMTWSVRTQMQFASTRLIGSEQFGAGGSTTVRGYDEGEVYEDNGILLSQQLSMPILGSLTSRTKSPGRLMLSLFEDAAWLRNNDPLPGERTATLHSVGLGLSYRWGSMSLRTDYGVQLRDSHHSRTGRNSRFHIAFNLNL